MWFKLQEVVDMCLGSHQSFHILIADDTDLVEALFIVDESNSINFYKKPLFLYLFLMFLTDRIGSGLWRSDPDSTQTRFDDLKNYLAIQ
jgi:hypothetical protein